HNYLGGVAETVNPANGSISIRIPVITPPGRGITLPFAFAYDSNIFLAGSPATLNWAFPKSLTSGAGWSNTAPILSLSQTSTTVPGISITGLPVSQTCGALVNYVFQDSSGGRHNLNLSVYGKTGANNGGDCSQAYGWYSQGGEGSILATTNPKPPQTIG